MAHPRNRYIRRPKCGRSPAPPFRHPHDLNFGLLFPILISVIHNNQTKKKNGFPRGEVWPSLGFPLVLPARFPLGSPRWPAKQSVKLLLHCSPPHHTPPLYPNVFFLCPFWEQGVGVAYAIVFFFSSFAPAQACPKRANTEKAHRPGVDDGNAMECLRVPQSLQRR